MNLNIEKSIEIIKSRSYESVLVFLDKTLKQITLITKKKNTIEELDDLMENLKKARNELAVATMNYEFAKEDELIDFYIYSMKAAQIKYDYLLKKVKEKGGTWGFEDIYDIKLNRQTC